MNPPQDFRPALSPVVILALHRYRITGLLRQILLTHFSQPAGLANALLAGLYWRPDGTGTMAIESLGAYRPSELPKRPAVLIGAEGWSFEKLGFGNRLEGHTPADGSTHYEIQVKGAHTVRAIMPGSPDAADVLAAELLEQLAGFADLIRQEFNLSSFMPTAMSPPVGVKEAEELWSVDLTLSYVMPLRWSTTMSAPTLKVVQLIPKPGS